MTRYPEPSTPPDYPEDSLPDRLADLGVPESAIPEVIAQVRLELTEIGGTSALKAFERLHHRLSRTLSGACLSIALLNIRTENLAEIGRRFGVSRQGVRQRIARTKKLLSL